MKRTFRELKKKTVRSTLSKEVAEIMKFAATNSFIRRSVAAKTAYPKSKRRRGRKNTA